MFQKQECIFAKSNRRNIILADFVCKLNKKNENIYICVNMLLLSCGKKIKRK
jgi:hypothetical protein